MCVCVNDECVCEGDVRVVLMMSVCERCEVCVLMMSVCVCVC